MAERVVERGGSVFVQDDPGDWMYVVAEGAVKLYVSSRDGGLVELARHHPPAAFGELALLDGSPRSASAVALERSVLLRDQRFKLVAQHGRVHHVTEQDGDDPGWLIKRSQDGHVGMQSSI